MNKTTFLVIVGLFILIVSGGIQKRTRMAVAPPVYDPIGYYFRAQYVWSALAKWDIHGVLNGPMAVRPPGTALILYPFGFKASVQSFLFRSALAPILIWTLALSISLLPHVRSRQDALLGAAFVVGLSCMPVFYHFELNELFTKIYEVTNQWGLVDVLEGSVAALAVTSLCVGIRGRNIKWCIIGWLMGALTFFIKPSGLLVMLTLLGITAVEILIQLLEGQSNRRTVLHFAASVYVVGFLLFGMAAWLGFGSEYMSRDVIAQAVKGQEFVLSMNRGKDLLGLLALLITPVLGWWWFCLGILSMLVLILEKAPQSGDVARNWIVLRLEPPA